MLLIHPAIEILHWRLVAERRMLTASIIRQGDFLRGVKDFNIFEAGSLHFSMGGITQTMVTLVFETVKPARGRRVDTGPGNARGTL